MRLLVDTSALYVLLDRRDQDHDPARRAFSEWLGQGHELLTHNYVVSESCALVQRRLGTDAAIDLLGALLRQIEVSWVSREIHDAAVAAFIAARSRRISLVDRVSFEVMRREGLDAAFAFDDGFQRAGFRTVP